MLFLQNSELRTISIFFLTLLIVRYIVVCWSRYRWDNFPPGPRGWPIVGYAPYLGRYPHKVMTELGKLYGDVFSLTIGPRVVVVVNGVDAVRETLVQEGDKTSGRTPPARAVTVDTSQGFFWTSHDLWRAQRKFGQSALRHIGQRNLDLEIQNEAAILCKEITQTGGDGAADDVNITSLMNNAVANIICRIVFGRRLDFDDVAFARMMELSFDIQQGGFSAIDNFLPSIYRLPFLFRQAKEKKRELRTFIRDMLYHSDPVVELPAEEARGRCMAERYFTSMAQQTAEPSSTGIQFNESHVVSAAWDMFIAGVETTAVTLSWAILFLTRHQDVQTKVQAEIDNVTGANRSPSWSRDRDHTPYTQAVIMEIQRRANIVPIALPHTVTEDCRIRGYTVPKGTTLFINLWSVLTDPKQWDEPETFRPERFLDSRGRIVKPAAFMPFSAGPRVCMGENLARMELFIFITTILQRYHLTFPKDQPHPSFEPLPGITCGPHPYKVHIASRRSFSHNE